MVECSNNVVESNTISNVYNMDYCDDVVYPPMHVITFDCLSMTNFTVVWEFKMNEVPIATMILTVSISFNFCTTSLTILDIYGCGNAYGYYVTGSGSITFTSSVDNFVNYLSFINYLQQMKTYLILKRFTVFLLSFFLSLSLTLINKAQIYRSR
jgi:hypothetical protein